jgi:putative methionine-R-sulfoxide reductase with GAF domain
MIKMMNENNYRDTKCKVIPTAKKTCTLAWSPNKVTFSGDYENEDNHISLMGFKME